MANHTNQQYTVGMDYQPTGHRPSLANVYFRVSAECCEICSPPWEIDVEILHSEQVVNENSTDDTQVNVSRLYEAPRPFTTISEGSSCTDGRQFQDCASPCTPSDYPLLPQSVDQQFLFVLSSLFFCSAAEPARIRFRHAAKLSGRSVWRPVSVHSPTQLSGRVRVVSPTCGPVTCGGVELWTVSPDSRSNS